MKFSIANVGADQNHTVCFKGGGGGHVSAPLSQQKSPPHPDDK